MKMTILNLGLTLVLLMTISISQSFPESDTDNFHINPLLLNGKSLDLTSVSTATTGRLSLVARSTERGELSRVIFYVYLKRAGKIVDGDSYGHNHPVHEIEMAGVLRLAMPGDQLVVDPVLENEKKWRRILTIQPSRPQPVIQWFHYGVNKGKDNC